MTALNRILVTGGAGFIGTKTVELLIKNEKQVIVLDNLSSGKLESLDLQHPNLEFIEGDILEFPLLVDLLASCDAVLHLAAIASVPYSIEYPVYSFQVNTQGFLHILEAIRKINKPIRLVYASSASVYGDTQQLPCDEKNLLSGQLLSPYALQKKNDEEYASLYAYLHGIKSLALRYFNVYGLGQDPHSPYSGVISRFLDAYSKDKELTIFGDGKQSRDFIHVSDIARANYLALQNDYAGVLNIATGKAQTLLNLIKYIETAGHHPAKVNFAPAKPGDVRASYANIHLAQEQLNFNATVSLEDGMKELWQTLSQEA